MVTTRRYRTETGITALCVYNIRSCLNTGKPVALMRISIKGLFLENSDDDFPTVTRFWATPNAYILNG